MPRAVNASHGRRWYTSRLVYWKPSDSITRFQSFLADGQLNGTGHDLLPVWAAQHGTPRLQSETVVRLGVDTTRMHPSTGPVAGSTLLLEASLGWQPLNDEVFGALRVDAQHHVPLPLGRGANLGLRASAATSGLGDYARSYWLSSYDTLRAYHVGDPALLGRHFWFAGAELQVPLDAVVRLPLGNLEAVAGLDFGGVSDELDTLWSARVLDGALGVNVVLRPFVLRLHWARAIDVGAPLPVTRGPWVTNVSLSWLGG